MPELDLPQIAESQALAYVTSNDADAKLEAALCSELSGHDPSAGDVTLSAAEFRGAWHHVIGGSPAAAFNFIIPAIARPFMVSNASGETATVKTATGVAGQVLDGETRLFYSDGTDVRSLTDTLSDGSGGGGHSGALVLLASDQSITNNTATPLNWGSESYDTDGYHDNTTNNSRLTVPTGVTKIILRGQIRWDSSIAGVRQFLVNKNGSGSFDGRSVGTLEAQSPLTLQDFVSPVLAVTPGDYFEVNAWQDSGGTRTVVSNVSCWFSIQAIE
ncbi:hypothetical protein [Sneathiella sp.]|uniref:hypothetical protein n=1 Tax=Sneathiella sp. TaxID=1964365 RepID=UPI0035663AF4